MSWLAGTLFLALLLFAPLIAVADESLIPKEAEITAEDQSAVDRLGPERGAIELIEDIRTLQDLLPTPVESR